MLSNSQIDRLGERLKAGTTTEDIELLNEYRDSFHGAYSSVFDRIESIIGSEPAGRPAKSILSIVSKLRRESIRLSQMQDIAGVRVVVADLAEQNYIESLVENSWERTALIDRLTRPNHGYRALHRVAIIDDRAVEIQIRTELQHEWAQLAERLSDRFPGVKYGEGDPEVRRTLVELSDAFAIQDGLIDRLHRVQNAAERKSVVTAIYHGQVRLSRHVELLKMELAREEN